MADVIVTSVNAETLASYFGVTTRTLANYRKAGMPMLAANRYDVPACIQWYVDFCAKEIIKKNTGKVTVDEDSVALRKLIAEAEMKELNVARARGTLVNISDVTKTLERYITPLRHALLGLSSRISPYLVMVPTQIEAQEIVEEHIRDLMSRMADSVDAIEIEADEPVVLEEEDDVETT